MKRFTFFASVMLAALMLIGCNPSNQPENKSQKGIDPFDKEAVDSYYGYAEISVPVGVTTVYLENYSGVDEKGNKKNLTVTPMEVHPEVAVPTDGKDVEPFGKVKLLFQAPIKTMVAVYYVAGPDADSYELAPERNAAAAPSGMRVEEVDDTVMAEVYTLSDFPVDQITAGTFGETRYVQMPWNFAWENSLETGWQNTKTYPKDVVFYDEAHNHTLRYKFAYAGGVAGEGYFLDDAYTIEDHVVTGYKYNYCGACGNCPYCMPWGCSCSCGSTNPDFVPNGDQTGSAKNDIVITEPYEAAALAPMLAPSGMETVMLGEPASYITSDQEQMFYHSSGCVFFEDSWPTVHTGGTYDEDFDDCVIDYDIEAKVMPDALLESDGWREQVKVVIHLRAVGSDQNNGPYRVGLQLKGFNTNNVESIDTYYTLDSYQNPHGELPNVTVNTLQNLSGHHETDPMNPIVEMAKLEVMGQQRAGLGADAEYTYVNGSFSNHTVFNLTYGFKGGPDESQYDPELATDPTLPYPFSQIMNQKFYNVIPGYINVAGGLFTMTVIYHMKPRIEMTQEEREAVKQNMISTVVNTQNQNFYIMKKDFSVIGLKGYDPVYSPSASQSKTMEKYNSGVTAGTLDPTIPYAGTNGAVWGFKCPTLTRHIWNKLYFSQGYPEYESWVLSGGATNQKWYQHVNEKYVVCWW